MNPSDTATSAPTPAATDSDLLLVERTVAGDQRAFELLVIKYQRRIQRLIGRMVRDVDLVEDRGNGLVVEPSDVNSLAEAICKLAQSADMRLAMGEESGRRAAMYSLPDVVRQMDIIYRCFLPKGGNRE